VDQLSPKKKWTAVSSTRRTRNRKGKVEKAKMSTLASDTNPDAEQVQIRIWRTMPAWRKLELVAQMDATVRGLALTGLRQRYPNASAAELARRLADRLLGDELATRVYGPLEEKAK
jgi:hypothetical protein